MARNFFLKLALASLLAFSVSLSVRADDFDGNINASPSASSPTGNMNMPAQAPGGNFMNSGAVPGNSGMTQQPAGGGFGNINSMPAQAPGGNFMNSGNSGMTQQPTGGGFGNINGMPAQAPGGNIMNSGQYNYGSQGAMNSSQGMPNNAGMPMQAPGAYSTPMNTSSGSFMTPSGSMPNSNYGNGYPQAMPNSNYGGDISSPAQSMPNSMPMQQGSYQQQYPGGGLGSHPLFNRLKNEFMGGGAAQNTMPGQAPAQPGRPGAMGVIRDLFGSPSNAQDAEQRAQADLNAVLNQKQQAINAFNELSGQSDRSKRASLATQIQNHAREARIAADKVIALSNQFQSPNLSNMAAQAQTAATYAQQMADQAETQLNN